MGSPEDWGAIDVAPVVMWGGCNAAGAKRKRAMRFESGRGRCGCSGYVMGGTAGCDGFER